MQGQACRHLGCLLLFTRDEAGEELDRHGIGACLAHVMESGVQILHRALAVLLLPAPYGPLQAKRTEVQNLSCKGIAHSAYIAPARLSSNFGLRT